MEPRPHRERFKPPKRFLHHVDMAGRGDIGVELCSEKGPGKLYPSEVRTLLLPATPTEVRSEVGVLLSDLVVRLKQLLFNSLICAYYVGFIPIQFAEVINYN